MTTTNTESIDTPLGRMSFASRGDALVALSFEEMWDEIVQRYELHADGARTTRSSIARTLERYFAGDVRAIEALSIDPRGTEFQKRVWKALTEVPAGETRSYGEIGAKVGCECARAVGTANAKNPIAIVVPCHRIVRSEGTLGGYAGGLDRKRWLLDHEARHAS